MVTIHDVFCITDYNGQEEKAKWTLIGTAFLNKDGSLNVILDAIPLNGKLHIRAREKAVKKVGEL